MNAIKTGDELLGAGNEAVALVTDPGDNFNKALFNYLIAQKLNPDNDQLNLKIGNCYLYTTNKEKAIKHLKRAGELNSDMDPDYHFYLGHALALEEDFDKALDEFKIFKSTGKSKFVEQLKKLTSRYVKQCKEAMQAVKHPVRVWVDNVSGINSSADEENPCISIDGESMLFNSNRSNGHVPNDFLAFDTDIYSTNLSNHVWSKPKNIGAPLNTSAEEGIGGLSYDGQRMLIHKIVEGNLDVYESTLEGTTWSASKVKMAKNVNNEKDQSYGCYEPNNIKVYYVQPGVKGGGDIYFSGIMIKESEQWNITHSIPWGKGQNVVNVGTKYDESSVYIHPDGETMYFSSQGHNSIGGYDIFMSKMELGQWKLPVRLGYPINTPYDDMFFAGTASGKYAYIASNRAGGKGGLDIYKVTFLGPKKPPLIDTEDLLLASVAKPVKDTYIAKEVKVERKSLTVFKGKVIDELTRQPIEAGIDITDNKKGKVIAKFNSNSASGKFLLSLPSGKNYGIAVTKEGYLFHSENFNLPGDSEFNLVHKDVELKNIKVGSKIALRNVFFATGKSEITSDSYAELNRLVKFLKSVPALKVELGGHTDNVGSEASNNTLSQKRADAVVKYLVDKGITATRLSAKGYGPSQPIDTNDTEEGRQLNRRTEFMITSN